MRNYMFIVNDLKIGYDDINYERIIETLFKEKEWIFPKTNVPNIDYFKKGDNVLLYVAGSGRRYFYGQFQIENSVEELKEYKHEFYKYFSRKINITGIKKWSSKVYMKDIKDNLDLIKDKKNYGLHLRQSVRELSFKDYEFISKKYNSGQIRN